MSRQFTVEPSFYQALVEGLERSLGPGYDVIPEPRYERWLDLRDPADLAVRERESGQVTLIVLKGGILDDDAVPLATVPQLRGVKNTNVHLHPRVVLVSTAVVRGLVANWLADDDIGVVRGRTADEVLPQLVDFITESAVAHR